MATTESPRYIHTQLKIALTNEDEGRITAVMAMLADYVRSLDIPGVDSVELNGSSVALTSGDQRFFVEAGGVGAIDLEQVRISGRNYLVVLDHLEQAGPFLAAAAALVHATA
jgi:hypothetical protein